MAEQRNFVVRYPTLRDSVQTLVLVLTVPALPLFVLLLLDGEIGTMPVVIGMLVYCLGVFGVSLYTESRKDRGLRGEVKFRVDESGIYFGASREHVSWGRVRSIVLRKNADGASPVMADVTVVCVDLAGAESYRMFQYAHRVKLKSAFRSFAPGHVLVTDTVVTDPVPSAKANKRRKRDR